MERNVLSLLAPHIHRAGGARGVSFHNRDGHLDCYVFVNNEKSKKGKAGSCKRLPLSVRNDGKEAFILFKRHELGRVAQENSEKLAQ